VQNSPGRSGSLYRFVLRRSAWAIPTVALVTILVFLVFEMLADPAANELGIHATPRALAELRKELGLDRPLTVRAAHQLLSLLQGELGISRYHGHPVLTLLLDGLGPTLSYAVPGFALASASSVVGGLFAARLDGGAIDRVLGFFSTILVSSSSLLIVLIAHSLLTHTMPLFPVSWPLTATGSESTSLSHIQLPTLLWALLQFGPDFRHYRALFVEASSAPHFDAMRARGLPGSRIFFHQLRFCAAPVCARLGHRLPHLLAGSVVIEYVFNIPGIGLLMADALHGVDLPLMQGLALTLTVGTIVAQLGSDLIAGVLDPRMRHW